MGILLVIGLYGILKESRIQSKRVITAPSAWLRHKIGSHVQKSRRNSLTWVLDSPAWLSFLYPATETTTTGYGANACLKRRMIQAITKDSQ